MKIEAIDGMTAQGNGRNWENRQNYCISQPYTEQHDALSYTALTYPAIEWAS